MRPQGMARSLIAHQIQNCPSCGYCAPDITQEYDQARNVMQTENYRQQLANPSLPALANHFLGWALIREAAGVYNEAGWAALHAARVCDDAAAPEPAKQCRHHALALFQQAHHAQMPFAKEKVVEAAVFADLLRRTEQFDRVEAVCQEGLRQGPKASVRAALLFQIALANRRDALCYSVEDAQKFAKRS
jgi:hypothetical protein